MKTEKAEPILKPCPFCGGHEVFLTRMNNTCNFVTCLKCSAEGPLSESQEDAIAAWNKRIDAT